MIVCLLRILYTSKEILEDAEETFQAAERTLGLLLVGLVVFFFLVGHFYVEMRRRVEGLSVVDEGSENILLVVGRARKTMLKAQHRHYKLFLVRRSKASGEPRI
jgi:hypothetical protein